MKQKIIILKDIMCKYVEGFEYSKFQVLLKKWLEIRVFQIENPMCSCMCDHFIDLDCLFCTGSKEKPKNGTGQGISHKWPQTNTP